jgi:hypothetical protein
MINPLLVAALDYAARGWPVFPVWWASKEGCACGKADCEHPGKHPIGKLAPNGRNSATMNPGIIKKWWGKYPQANIGIATGPESGLLVVDLDPRNGSEASLKRLEREHGALPVFTPKVHTGGGGEHSYLAHPGHKVKSDSGIAGYSGIDIKGDGGYVLAPPSTHISGKPYSWRISPGQPLAPCPQWLLKLLAEAPNQVARRHGNDEPILKGQRNEKLTSLAGSMRRRGMGPEEIKAALLAVNSRCEPALPEAEVRRIAQSVGRYDPTPASVVTATSPEKTYLPVPPPFPVEVFPADSQRAIAEIQRAYGVPLEIPGIAFLGTAGGCIGRARGVRIKQGWEEHGNLWFAIVAPSGYGKSPAVREIQRLIFALEKKWFAEYREGLEQFNSELEQRRLTRKDERASLPPPPTPPEWRQLIVDDTTTEALTDALAANPRGILWNRDELSGLIADLDRYARKEGGAKARLMSSYDSGPWKVNRREASKRAFIRHATLSILGTIQPQALPTIFSDLDAATGFLPRFIFVSATREAPPLWTDEIVSTATRDYLASIFERLLALNLDEQDEPVIIRVNREAKGFYENWFNEQALEPWQNVEASIYEAVLAKLRGQCLRFALILHCLEAVDAGRPDTAPISRLTMEKAISLANCFKTHQRNAWQTIINQDKVAELPPLHRQVARAILSLEGEIVGGMLATARITEQMNQGLDSRFHVSPDTVGKTAAVLTLTTDKLPDSSCRGFRIKPEDLHRLNSFFSSKICVPSVPSDHTPVTMRLSGDKSSVPEVSQVTGGDGVSGHLGHLPDTCKMSEKAHEQSISDTSGTSGTSSGRGKIIKEAHPVIRPLFFTWNRDRQRRAALTLRPPREPSCGTCPNFTADLINPAGGRGTCKIPNISGRTGGYPGRQPCRAYSMPIDYRHHRGPAGS